MKPDTMSDRQHATASLLRAFLEAADRAPLICEVDFDRGEELADLLESAQPVYATDWAKVSAWFNSVQRLKPLVRHEWLKELTTRARGQVSCISDKSFDTLHSADSTATQLDRAIARNTSEQYERDFSNVITSGTLPYAGTRSKATARKYTAACRVILKRAVTHLCECLDNECYADPDATPQAVRELYAALDLLVRVNENLDTPRADSSTNKRASKKSGLGREAKVKLTRIHDAFKPSDDYAWHVATLMVFGIRPVEFERGVCLTTGVDNDGMLLTVRIKGAKRNDQAMVPGAAAGSKIMTTTGQATREITLRDTSENPFVSALIEHMNELGVGSLDLTAAKPKAICDAVRRLTARAGFKRAKISAYNFRHEFAATLKRDVDSVDCAAALGHASCRTQTAYGNRKRSGGTRGLKVVRVTSSTPPRAQERARHRPKIESRTANNSVTAKSTE